MRATWPLLWLLAAMSGVAALAWRIGGRNAALIALVISAGALPAFQHFKPGRIDHHNVQIALAVAVVAAAAWSDRARHAAALAGMLTGLAAAVGLESLPFLVLGGGALALRFVWHGERETANVPMPQSGARALTGYGLAVAASTLAGFAAVVAPANWGRPACDAMAVNWLLAVAIAGLGLALVARAPLRGAVVRGVAVVLVGAAALAAFVALEPRCIYGPFALTDPAVKSIWLDHVDETEPLVSFVRGFPLLAAWMCSFPLVGLVAACVLARDAEARRDFGFLLAAAAFLVSVAVTLGAEKIYSYSMWAGMPLVAALVARLIASPGRRADVARLAAALVLMPMTVTATAFMVIQAVADESPAKSGARERVACTRNEAFASLAQLRPGLVATEINYGPFVLALTPHSVIAAPYHRISAGMVAAHTIFAAPPPEARRVVDAYGVGYVAICGHHAFAGIDPPEGSLWAELNDGRPPAWLERVAGAAEDQFVVYRVRR
jgi:hypothetical protein